MLKGFDPVKFSSNFSTNVLNVGSMEGALKEIRNIRAQPNIDAYVIELGVNDLKSKSPEVVLDLLDTLLGHIRSWSPFSKIIISPPLLTKIKTDPLSQKVRSYRDLLDNWIASFRRKDANLFSVYNRSLINIPDERLNDVYEQDDATGIHLNAKGTSWLAAVIKRTVFHSLDIPYTRRADTTSNES